MPLRPLFSRLRSLAGWFWLSPVEWAIVLLIVWLVVRGAWPRYQGWRAAELLRSEQYTVTQVRAALSQPGAAQASCPATLDTCPDGSTPEGCRLFSKLDPMPTPLSRWRKERGCYIGPAGGWYRYEPNGCQFRLVSPLPDER